MGVAPNAHGHVCTSTMLARSWVRCFYIVTVDAQSKWIEDNATSTGTIRKLRQMFATYGIPETIVSDNGSVFTSKEFQQFVKLNSIKHVTTALYHLASNGLAERAVQTLKIGLKKIISRALED